MQPTGGSPKDADRFDGAVSSLGLPDLIQSSAVNRFSGCISVAIDSSSGAIFFRDGQIIHAEAGEKSGEEAFYEIMQWTGSKIVLQPKVTTTGHSIDRNWKFLVLESARIIDERRRAAEGASPAPVREKLASIVEKIREIPGVVHATLQSKEQVDASPEDRETETLEGQTAYLAKFGRRVGEIFRTGEVLASVVHGEEWNLLLLATKNYHLSILMEGGSQAGAIEAEIRKLLAARR